MCNGSFKLVVLTACTTFGAEALFLYRKKQFLVSSACFDTKVHWIRDILGPRIFHRALGRVFFVPSQFWDEYLHKYKGKRVFDEKCEKGSDSQPVTRN